MRIEPQAASRLEAMPVALIAQSVTVLAQNAESLRRTIDAFVLGNPLLEYAPAGPNPAEALDIAELAVARRATLAEHLGMQLRIAERDPEVLRIGRMIIESLDKYGYLREHTEDMLRASHASPAAFARALAAVQALEPCGVAARSLGECLALQLRARTAPEPLALEIVTGHLEEMAAGTLRLPGHAAEEIEAACREANCDSFIRKMEKGYDTPTGENGNLLSGGERQRISIARAILKNSPILLLDEATASLDIENELAVKQAIANLLKEKKTVVMIAHTLSIVKNADQILVMGDGRIAESGTHEELLAKGGKYAAMWNAEQKISA